MTIKYLCVCGALVPKPGRCPDCQRADDRRRNRKRVESGRTTAAWQRLRAAAIHRDNYTCQRCGVSGTVKTLTVHLRPELGGNHRAATLDDLVTLCRSCHGKTDAPRAHAGFLSRTPALPPLDLRERNGETQSRTPSVG